MSKMGEVFGGNRSRFEIIAEILRKLREPTCRTNIVSQCNMNTAQSGQYLDFLASINLIRIDAASRKVTYQRTEAGREFLKLFNKMVLLLDPGSSPVSLIACL